MFWSTKSWDAAGKHCYITGGSSGLGLALAKMLAAQGAHVSIVARDEQRLARALVELETVRQSKAQLFQVFSYSLLTAEASEAALKAAMERHSDVTPDAAFLCAGKSIPRFFVEYTTAELTEGMDFGYWVQAWSAWFLAKKMVAQRRTGSITFVSSTLGLMTVPGYSGYCPGKHALRGLADTLRCEFLLYGIDIHIFFPPTMFTPSYEEENKIKPALTKKIEEADGGLTAEQAAMGQAHITADFLTDSFRVSSRGSAPSNGWILDGVIDLAARVWIPLWSTLTDRRVRAHREGHYQHLQEIGFFAF
ncbi:oxidoreductase [Auriscalpium vulgare]|uniref:Oxidoreductase n=1 Tax=Auriscalpium vulgare TaxID=40419 RepID=A0ACB8RYY6_9AGAM|nr:oxidoreductase [Auriscalpium vulgare]